MQRRRIFGSNSKSGGMYRRSSSPNKETKGGGGIASWGSEAEAEAEGEGERTQELSEGDKFEAWKRRAEAIVELREAQEDRRNQDYRKWEDWLLDGDGDGNGKDNTSSWEQGMKDYRENVRADSGDVPVEKGFVESARYLIFGRGDGY